MSNQTNTQKPVVFPLDRSNFGAHMNDNTRNILFSDVAHLTLLSLLYALVPSYTACGLGTSILDLLKRYEIVRPLSSTGSEIIAVLSQSTATLLLVFMANIWSQHSHFKFLH